MPTILYINGWRLFFYSNENNEPIHVHAEKGDMDCKYWILPDDYEVKEAFHTTYLRPQKKKYEK